MSERTVEEILSVVYDHVEGLKGKAPRVDVYSAGVRIVHINTFPLERGPMVTAISLRGNNQSHIHITIEVGDSVESWEPALRAALESALRRQP